MKRISRLTGHLLWDLIILWREYLAERRARKVNSKTAAQQGRK